MRYFRNSIRLPKTLKQQAEAIRNRWPGFVVEIKRGKLIAIGALRPTPRSEQYTVQITYSMNERPDIVLLSHKIERNFKNEKPEHLYSEDRLCLYRPIYGEFTFGDLICETIIPWISLWLYHYESWHLTGDWLGGGEHPG